MKKLSALLITLCIGGTAIFVSCSKNGPAGPQGQNGNTGPSGPLLTGTITGNVIISNEYGANVTNDYTGGYILLKNSTTGVRVDSVFADSTGKYTIPNVQTGTYTMLCIYAGYGLNEHENLEFISGTLQVDNKIAAIPTFTINTAADSVRHKTNMNYLYGTLTVDANGARTILVFIGNTPSTSAAPGTYSFIDNVVVAADSSNFTITTPLNTFYANGFTHGSTAYLAIYGAANNYTYGDYMDYASGQLIYTAISPTYTTASVALP
jgi:hypothetical protein